MLWDTSKVSQIRIHLIENIEKYIGTCITKLFPHVLRKPSPSSIINGPHKRHDEFGRITWFFIGDGKHVPTHLHHGFHCFSIHVVHPIYFFLHFFDHHGWLLLKSELLIEEHLLARIHPSIFPHPRFEEVSSFFHEIPIESAMVFLDSVTAFKES